MVLTQDGITAFNLTADNPADYSAKFVIGKSNQNFGVSVYHLNPIRTFP